MFLSVAARTDTWFQGSQACQLKNVTSLRQKLPQPRRDATAPLAQYYCVLQTGAQSNHLSYLE